MSATGPSSKAVMDAAPPAEFDAAPAGWRDPARWLGGVAVILLLADLPGTFSSGDALRRVAWVGAGGLALLGAGLQLQRRPLARGHRGGRLLACLGLPLLLTLVASVIAQGGRRWDALLPWCALALTPLAAYGVLQRPAARTRFESFLRIGALALCAWVALDGLGALGLRPRSDPSDARASQVPSWRFGC